MTRNQPQLLLIPLFVGLSIWLFFWVGDLAERRCRASWDEGYSYDLMIADCTLLIQLGGRAGYPLAVVYNDRGVSYRWRRDFKQAIADARKIAQSK